MAGSKAILTCLIAAACSSCAFDGRAQSLSEAIDYGLANSPRMSAARSSLDLAREQLVGAASAGRMRVQVEGVASQRDERNETLNIFNRQTESSVSQQRNSVAVSLSQPLYTGGRLSTNLALSRSRITGAEIALAESEILAARNIAAAYSELVRAEAVVEILENSIKSLTLDVAAANARFEAGEVSRTDIAQSDSRLASVQGQAARALSDLISARANFERFVGAPPQNIDRNLPLPPLPKSRSDFADVVMGANLSLRLARSRYAIAEATARSASTERNPSISLDAVVDRRWNEGFAGAEASSARVSARVVVPLWDGGAASSGVRQALAQASVARYQLSDLEAETQANIARVWANRAATYAILEASDRQVSAAEFARRGTLAELRFGLRSTIEALNQEVELRQALIGQAAARRDHYVAEIEAASLMGLLPLGNLPRVLDPRHQSVVPPPAVPKPLLIERPVHTVLEFLEANDRPIASAARTLNQALQPNQQMGPLP